MIKIPIITGPTACGKTALSLKLAEQYRIELISADAYQVYQHMNIGTAKPEESELNAVKHHLIDFLNPNETYSAGDFFEQVQSCIKDVLSRDHLPLIIGGTAMYVNTLMKGIFDGPARDESLRNRLELVIDRKGVQWLHGYLSKIDPDYAAKISENDHQRIIRAVEVYKKIGMPFSRAHKELMIRPDYDFNLFVLNRDRADLYHDINRRVIQMFEAGWVDEVKGLLSEGYRPDIPSFKAIGYREIADIVSGNDNEAAVIKLIQKKTRNFAKRQLTWFRNMDDVTTIQIDQEETSTLLDLFNNEYSYYRKSE